jgi:hypothetical protein
MQFPIFSHHLIPLRLACSYSNVSPNNTPDHWISTFIYSIRPTTIEVDPENVDTRRKLWQASRELKTIHLVDISEEMRPEVRQRNTGP